MYNISNQNKPIRNKDVCILSPCGNCVYNNNPQILKTLALVVYITAILHWEPQCLPFICYCFKGLSHNIQSLAHMLESMDVPNIFADADWNWMNYLIPILFHIIVKQKKPR